MNDALVMGVLHGAANLGQELEARRRIEIVAACVLVQGPAANKLHGEKRPAVDRTSRFIHLGDPGVLKPAQNLPSWLKRLRCSVETRPGRITFNATVRRGLSCSAS